PATRPEVPSAFHSPNAPFAPDCGNAHTWPGVSVTNSTTVPSGSRPTTGADVTEPPWVNHGAHVTGTAFDSVFVHPSASDGCPATSIMPFGCDARAGGPENPSLPDMTVHATVCVLSGSVCSPTTTRPTLSTYPYHNGPTNAPDGGAPCRPIVGVYDAV